MRKRSVWILLLVAGLIIIGGLFLWRRSAAGNEPEQARTAVVESGTLRVTVTASGRIEPDTRVDLSFDMPGRVERVAVELGDVVEAGQMLARLQTSDLQRAVTQAELSLRQAELRLEQIEEPADEAEIRRAENALSQAAAALEVARINLNTVQNSTLLNETLEDAQSAYDDAKERYDARLEEYEEGEIDYWFVDQAEQRLEDAERYLSRIRDQVNLQSESASNDVTRAYQSYQEAQDALDQLQAGADASNIRSAELDVETARLALERAQSDLEKATLVAPFDGVVSAVNVTAGEIAPTGVPAISLVGNDNYQLTVSVDEIDVAKLETGLPVQVTVDALPGRVFEGVVERIGPAASVDQGAISYPVVIALEPTDGPLRTGMSATATILVEELEEQLLIPNWTVQVDQTTGQMYVYRQTAQGPQRMDVELGARQEGYSQVLEGLEAGDTLVLVREDGDGFFGGRP
jgi:HlyD family secretion protein